MTKICLAAITVLVFVFHADLDLVNLLFGYIFVRIYSGDITTGTSHSINYSAPPMRPVYVSILNFFKKEKYFRDLRKFGKSILISWCQIAKHKTPIF